MAAERVALVTGSGKRRIGRAVAEALAERGYALALHYRTSSAEAASAAQAFQAREVQAIALGADLTDEKQARDLVDRVAQHFGRLDVLVNCASIYGARQLEQITADDLRANFDANVLSVFLCSQQAGLRMIQQETGGNIVLLGDWADARPYLGYAAYFASKGAIPALTRCLAVELGTRNPRVRVNCILPGPVMLPADMPQAEKEQAINGTLVRREGGPHSIAQAVAYLIENDFVTGSTMTVDGGRTVYAGGG